MEEKILKAKMDVDKLGKVGRLEVELEKLRLKPFSNLIGFVVLFAIYILFEYMNNFEGELHLHFAVLLACFSLVSGESYRINKRVDIVLKIVRLESDR